MCGTAVLMNTTLGGSKPTDRRCSLGLNPGVSLRNSLIDSRGYKCVAMSAFSVELPSIIYHRRIAANFQKLKIGNVIHKKVIIRGRRSLAACRQSLEY